MATTKTFIKNKWDTLHNNGPFDLKLLHVTELEGESSLFDKYDRYNDAAQEIHRLIKDAHNAGQGFRPYGSKWSLSYIAHQKDQMQYNGFMNLHIPLQAADMHSNSNFQLENLFFFQCGNIIKEISKTLSTHGKSLKTTGASNGQTIAGCISTGVHGSALGVGSVQDYVVGINLIIGPNANDRVYIERQSKPALSDSFAQKINSRIIRDDEIFNAALVGLGSFGFIHGVVIEAEDKFLLKRYVRKIDKKLALKLADTMDFKNSSFKVVGETDNNGKPLTPYHYKIFINPYTDKKDTEYVIEVMYKKPYKTPYPDPLPDIEQSIYKDLILLLVRISEKFPKSIPWFIKRLRKSILPDVTEQTTGMLGEIFWDAPYQGPAFAISFGVDHKNASKALKILSKLTNDNPVPGIYAMRFIKKSDGLLAFSQFPTTCMIEIDGVLWKKSRKLKSLEEFSSLMIKALKSNNIPFTIHWGKNMDWKFPNLVNHMYGQKAARWQEIRSQLLSRDMAALFSNRFLKHVGLNNFIDPQPPIPPDPQDPPGPLGPVV